MSPQLKEMISNLKALEEFCDQMIRLTMSEREALIKNKLEQLTSISESKNVLSRKIAGLRDRTREIALEMAPQGPGVKTIEQLLPHLPDESRNILSGPYASFRGKASELRFHNTHNMILAKYGLRSIEGRVTALVSAIQGANATYKPPGQTSGGALARLGRVHREA